MRAWAFVCVAGLAVQTQAAVVIPTVQVGSPGNAADTRFVAGGRGSVGYTYSIGQFEVTAGQYTEFLNSVAKQDPYLVYHSGMATYSGITRSGTPANYTYTLDPAYVNRPIETMSYMAAARFVNWLNNGQPVGPMDLTTEDGAYFLNGSIDGLGGAAIQTRRPGAVWVLPTLDEWYKAAYYNPASSSYWTWTNNALVSPLPEPPPGGLNSANAGSGTIANTNVGAYFNSPGPNGAFDMGGNVQELQQAVTIVGAPLNGGYYDGDILKLRASNFDPAGYAAGLYWARTGFRVVQLPEPSAMAVVAFAALFACQRRTTRR